MQWHHKKHIGVFLSRIKANSDEKCFPSELNMVNLTKLNIADRYL